MKISVKQWQKSEGISNEAEFMERLESITSDGICPALCSEGCEVEPDGQCEHGCNSLLLDMGLI